MSSDGPFVYTPFFRRFTDERARDSAETRELYDSVRARYFSSRYAKDDAVKNLVLSIAGDFDTPHVLAFCVAMDGVLRQEDSIFGFPEVILDHLSLKEQVELNRLLRAKDYFFAHEERILTSLVAALELIFGHIARQLPKTHSPSPFVIPLAFALPAPKQLIDEILATLWKEEYVKNGLFVHLTRRLHFNLCEVSGISDPFDVKKPFVLPSKQSAPLSAIVHDYLKETPFEPLFAEPVALQLSHEERFSHMHVVGGSGAGKTQLLQSLILHDLTSEERPALVIVDSQGDLISKLMRLDLPFDPILITPKDIDHPPALNVFDVKQRGYDQRAREQVTAGVIQTFDYLFAGLFGADLTAKQSVFFRFVARLMLSLPATMGRNATILDMLALMDDATPYAEAIDGLPDIQRQFFERDFGSKSFVQTKEQIRYRLQAVLENPTLARLFTSPETKVDLFTELNNGSVILVDTAKDFLKGSSGHFGRIFISLVLQAILERAVIPEHERTHAFLVVDEAAQYFDQNIDDLLTEARKYKLGCVFAHQFLDQCTSQLRSSLAANTAIKMAAGVSTSDARALAADMRTSPEFILGQPRLTFACHVRGVTPQAVAIPVNAGLLEAQPERTDYGALIDRNRQRVSSAPSAPPPKPARKVDTEDASEW